MNRTVLITGSTRGIGVETAAEFLKKGDQVVIFSREKQHVEEARERLLAFGKKEALLSQAGDVRKRKDVERIIRKSMKRFGRIDVLINNAGVGFYGPVEETTEEKWDHIIDTNLKGTFLFLRQIIPIMKRQGKGIIVNISSGLGVEGMGNFSAYSASKFGVVGLTRALADELSDSTIRIYAVLPGAVDTTLLADSGFQMDPSDLLRPEYVARKIFEAAQGRRRSGSLITVYS
ncbi:MAG: SDR family oxidoreductase [Deltaproteobacteria bacterium]|nr:SDR family oxidoreductase [Deltaproteobacteria bacterium]